MRPSWGRVVLAGLAGGFVGNGILGALFSSPLVRGLLYDPSIQSALFIDITPKRDIPLSVGGLVLLSVVHSWLFATFRPCIPGSTWVRRGLFWGVVIWSMYWLFQEWFIYHTLLNEPIALNVLELSILLIGSLAEGLTIGYVIERASRTEAIQRSV